MKKKRFHRIVYLLKTQKRCLPHKVQRFTLEEHLELLFYHNQEWDDKTAEKSREQSR
jgi:hypothetical protein